MIKGRDIICISSIDWDFIWQGHQEIMSSFAKNGNRILFIENTGIRAVGIKDIPRLRKRVENYFKGIKGIRKEMDNLYIFSPLLLPFPYSHLARQINKFLFLSVLKKWMQIMDFSDPIIWTFLPTGIALDIINNVNHKILIYYCIDNFYVSSSAAKKIRRTEKKLLKIADLVFVTSRALYDYCIKYTHKVNIFPFGVNIVNFEKIRIAATETPDDLKNIKKPIVGYVGGIHKWIDQNLIKFLAENNPNLSFLFIGPLQTDISLLSGIKNIYFLGNKKHYELPYFIKNFSLTMIPYLITDYTKNVYPTKLNEYLAMGKPVISTELPEILMFNQRYKDIIYVANNERKFSESIKRAIREDSEVLRRRRIEIAGENSWDKRVEQMCNLIEKAIEDKKLDKEMKWKENLLTFYRTSRKKLLRLGAISIAVYLLLFYTPLIWMLAGPLEIANVPDKAEAIVVLAGGVGESGKAGQGYEERVKYAVKLYNGGFASKIIFSSGYMFVFKEPLIMEALAISLGIPKNAIILEDKAKNTYENIKFSKEILEQNGWNRILLVSSPYHMRRVSLLFNKFAKNIIVRYTPIPNSFFYSHPNKDNYGKKIWKKISLEQMNGIFHEYLGILYYWLKGWI